VQAVALGSKAVFRYTPTKDEVIKYYAKMNGLNEKSVVYDSIPEEDVKEANKALQAAEELQPIQNRKTEGDASEAGLVKFVEPILGLEKERAKYPTFSYNVGDNKQIEALIPFSSEIKFNMFVRDMNVKEKNP
jgi:hypothetical protein